LYTDYKLLKFAKILQSKLVSVGQNITVRTQSHACHLPKKEKQDHKLYDWTANTHIVQVRWTVHSMNYQQISMC